MSIEKWLNNQSKKKDSPKDKENENSIKLSDNENNKCYELNMEKWIGKKNKIEDKKIDNTSLKSNFIRETIGNRKYLFKNESSFIEPVKNKFLDFSKFYGTSTEEKLKNSKVNLILYPSKELENLIKYIENKLRLIFGNIDFQILLNRSGAAVIISKNKSFGITVTPSEEIEPEYYLNAWFRTKKTVLELFNSSNGFIVNPNSINNIIREVSIKKNTERISIDDILDWFQKNKENIMH